MHMNNTDKTFGMFSFMLPHNKILQKRACMGITQIKILECLVSCSHIIKYYKSMTVNLLLQLYMEYINRIVCFLAAVYGRTS